MDQASHAHREHDLSEQKKVKESLS